MKKKDNKQCLSDTPSKIIQMPYKTAKFEKHLTPKKFFGIAFLHAHAKYIYIVNAKDQKPSVKSLVQVDFPVYAQAKSLFKSKQEKNGSFQKAVVLSKNIFWGIKLLRANVQ